MDGIVVPGDAKIGDAVVGDLDGHVIVTTHGVNDPCAIVEDCDASDEHAVAGKEVDDGAHVIVGA